MAEIKDLSLHRYSARFLVAYVSMVCSLCTCEYGLMLTNYDVSYYSL